jgi:hypothetical protein
MIQPATKPSGVTVAPSAGTPGRVTALAKLLLQLHREPVLHLVHEQPRSAVPPVHQGQV